MSLFVLFFFHLSLKEDDVCWVVCGGGGGCISLILPDSFLPSPINHVLRFVRKGHIRASSATSNSCISMTCSGSRTHSSPYAVQLWEAECDQGNLKGPIFCYPNVISFMLSLNYRWRFLILSGYGS